jgi:C-terminal processing protease CtpA/Prc
VAILTNRQTFSAAEWFVLFVKVMPNVTIIGDTTGGGSAKTILRELSNGWTLRTSNTQTLMSNGCDFQFTGLFPDIPIWISPEDYNREVDTILEKAILLLNNK